MRLSAALHGNLSEYMEDEYKFEKLGGTLDDAIGESFTEINSQISGVSNKVDGIEKQITDEVWKDTIIEIVNEDGETVQTSIENLLVQHQIGLDGISSTVSDIQSDYYDDEGISLSEKVSSLQQDADGFKLEVSQTYTSKQEFSICFFLNV